MDLFQKRSLHCMRTYRAGCGAAVPARLFRSPRLRVPGGQDGRTYVLTYSRSKSSRGQGNCGKRIYAYGSMKNHMIAAARICSEQAEKERKKCGNPETGTRRTGKTCRGLPQVVVVYKNRTSVCGKVRVRSDSFPRSYVEKKGKEGWKNRESTERRKAPHNLSMLKNC